jgi:hypothetical protein
MTGTYYIQYYDVFFDYAKPIFKYTHNIDSFDCQSAIVNVPQATYDRDSRPLKKRLGQPYVVF